MPKAKASFDLDAFKRRIQEEGLPVAFETALAVCNDPDAPAAARAQASANIFRINGLFALKEPTTPKEAHEMTPDEIDRAIGELRSAAARRQQLGFDDPDEEAESEDVFG